MNPPFGIDGAKIHYFSQTVGLNALVNQIQIQIRDFIGLLLPKSIFIRVIIPYSARFGIASSDAITICITSLTKADIGAFNTLCNYIG